jgi:hypothetical protein
METTVIRELTEILYNSPDVMTDGEVLDAIANYLKSANTGKNNLNYIFETHVANLEKAIDHAKWFYEVEGTQNAYGNYQFIEGSLEATKFLFEEIKNNNLEVGA